jgi:hypothetical protein
MNVRRDKFLSFARHLALLGVSGVSPMMMACGASNTGPTTTTAPGTSSSNVSTSPPPGDATAGSGPCRCSWDTNASAAPRVCKKGEINYDGDACIPGHGGPSYGEGGMGPMPVPGPLPPPDLAIDQRYG